MTRLATTLLITGLLFVSPAVAQDAQEPNNNFDSAFLLTPGTPLNGTIHQNGDEDYFRLELQEAGVLVVAVTGVPSVNWYVALYNASRNRITNWTANAGAGLDFTYLLAAGTYYLELADNGSNSSASQAYTLAVSLDRADANEPNNTLDQATPLPLGSSVTGTALTYEDNDYFSVEVDRPGVLEIDVTGIAGVDWYVALYNNSRDRITQWTSNTGADVFVTYLLNAGRYYVRLVPNYSNQRSSEPYTLTVTLNTTDPNEPNNTFATATLIGPDVFVPGTIWSDEDVDVYRFEVTAAGVVGIEITDVPQNLAFIARLYNPGQSQIDYRDGNEGQSLTYQVSLPGAGAYYLSVRSYYSNRKSAQPYQVRVTGAVVRDSRSLQPGDVSANGVIDAGDASLTLRWVVGLASLSSTQRQAADVDANSAIQAADASLILQRVVGLITRFPADGSGKAGPEMPGAGHLAWGAWETVENTSDVLIPVHLRQVERPVTALELAFTYDPALLRVEDVRSLVPADWLLSEHTSPSGETRIALAGATPITESLVLVVRARLLQAATPADLTGHGTVGAAAAQPLAAAPEVPISVILEQNFPNPFNPRTTIRYGLPEAGHVRLAVYAMDGRLVATLVDEHRPAGIHDASLEALDLASGPYLYRLDAGGSTRAKVMVLLK